MPEAAPAAPAAATKPVNTTSNNGIPKPAVASATTPPAQGASDGTKAPEQKYVLTVDGEEREVTRAEAQRLLGKAAYADKTVKATKDALAKIKEREEQLKQLESIWDDDARLEAELEKRGKLDALARKRLEAKVAESQMTPEQKAIAERDAEIARLKKSDEERAEKEKAAKAAEAQKVIQQQMESQLAAAAERAGMAKDADSFHAIYEAVKEWVRLGLPWDADRIVETAQQNVEASFDRLRQSATKGLKGKALIDKLGADVVKEVLRYKVEELRNGGTKPQPVTATPKKEEAPTWISPTSLQNKYRGGA